MNVGSLMMGVLHINYKDKGWAEKYYLPHTEYTPAKIAFSNVCNWRAALLTKNATIVWARVSFVGQPNEAKAAISAPIPALKQFGQPGISNLLNDPNSSVHFRYETSNGLYSNRLWRGLPDDWITDFLADPLSLGTTLPLVLPVLSDQTPDLDLTRGFLKVVYDNTVYARKIAGPAPTFQVEPWDAVIYRGTSSRQTGVPFGMSRGRARTHS